MEQRQAAEQDVHAIKSILESKGSPTLKVDLEQQLKRIYALLVELLCNFNL